MGGRLIIGVGVWAEQPARVTPDGLVVEVNVLYPRPASPAANRGWAEAATRQLAEMGIVV